MSELRKLKHIYLTFSIVGPLLVAAVLFTTYAGETRWIFAPILMLFCYLLCYICFRFQKDSARELRLLLREVKEFRGLVDSTLLVASFDLDGNTIFSNELFAKVCKGDDVLDWDYLSRTLRSQGHYDGLIELKNRDGLGESLMISLRPVLGEENQLSHYILFGQLRTSEAILLEKVKASEKALLDVASIQNKFLHDSGSKESFEDIIKSLSAFLNGDNGFIYNIEYDRSTKRPQSDYVFDLFYSLPPEREYDLSSQLPIKFKRNSLEQTFEYTLDLETGKVERAEVCVQKEALGIFLRTEGRVIGAVGLYVNKLAHGFEYSKGQLSALNPFVDMAALLLNTSISHQKMEALLTQYEEAQSAAKIGNWYVELEGYHVTWSAEMYKFFDQDPSKSPPTIEDHRSLIHPEDIGIWEQSVEDLLEYGTPYKVVFRLVKGGRETWLETNARAIVDENGKTIAAFGTTQDVSEARALLAENIRKEQTLSTILRYVPLSIMTLDTKGQCGYVNKEWSRLTGAHIHETLGLKWMNYVYEEDLEEIQNRLASLGESGLDVQKFEFRIISPKDNLIRWASAQLIRMTSNEESESGYLLTLLDITEIKRSEREVNKALNRLELALYSGELGLWDWNLTTNEITYDDRWCSMLGYQRSEIDRSITGFSSLVHPDDYASVFKKVDQYLRGEIADYEVIVRMKHKDGRWIPVLSKGKVIERRDDGSPRRFTGTHLDFTRQAAIESELREAKERAEKMTRVKTVFLANMSHEIRSPLNGIVGMSELLEAHVSDSEGRQFLRSIQSCSETLLRIIGDILDYSKMEEGRFDINVGKYNLKDVVFAVVQSFEGIKRKKQVDFVFNCDESLDENFFFDSVRVRQILFNLLSNAFKFTPEGVISLTMKMLPHSEDIFIEVKDTGVGIAKEDEHLLFERFSQIDSGMTKSAEGTGLGLVIVKNLVTLMGGSVRFSSEKGQGTTFSINLPLKKAVGASVEVKGVGLVANTPSVPILVAEDNPINQALMRKLLEKSGHQVTIVSNGEEVLEALEKNSNFALILMDLQMPKIDGLSATKLLKERYTKAPPVVAVTANVFEEDREACLSVGMVDFITKPIRRSDLEQVVSRYALQWQERIKGSGT